MTIIVSGFKDYREVDLEVGDTVCVLYTYGRRRKSRLRTGTIDSFTPKKVRFKLDCREELYVTYSDRCIKVASN